MIIVPPIDAIGFAFDHFKKAVDKREQHLPIVLCINGKYAKRDSSQLYSNIYVCNAPLSDMLIINPFAEGGIEKLIQLDTPTPQSNSSYK